MLSLSLADASRLLMAHGRVLASCEPFAINRCELPFTSAQSRNLIGMRRALFPLWSVQWVPPPRLLC